MTSDFVGYIGVAKIKRRNHWVHHRGHVTWLQFKDQKQKRDQELIGLGFIKLYTRVMLMYTLTEGLKN